MGKIVWSSQAANDLIQTAEYLELASFAYACWFGDEVLRKIESAATQPYLGALVPEYQMENLRERRVDNYRIIYRVHRDAIRVVTIIHGARLLPSSPEDLTKQP